MIHDRQIGELGLAQYLSLAEAAAGGEDNTLLRRALALHGARSRAIDSARRFAKLIAEFGERFGADRSISLYESPGRVNLLGMHIDHRGGVCNPVATWERIRAVCARRDDDVLRAHSLLRSPAEGQFRLSERLPKHPLHSLGEWLNWTEGEALAIGGGRDFINYFACGPVYLACFSYPWGQRLFGADFLLDSDLPPSAGLSSSSAVVLLATDFFLRCNPEGRPDLDMRQLLDVYGYGEWYIGTRGGTGDHAAIKLSKRGAIQPVITTPEIRLGDPAPIPEGYRIVLYQSGDEANKSVEPFKTGFNAPIISYQVAEMFLTDFVRDHKPQRFADLMKRRATLDARHHRVYLGDVVSDEILSEAEIYRFLALLPQRMSQADVFSRLRSHGEAFQAGILQAREPEGGYHVRDVAAYGLSECARAKHAARVLADGDIQGFAHMMNISQLGDRVAPLDNPAHERLKHPNDVFLKTVSGTVSAEHPSGRCGQTVPDTVFSLRELAGDYHVSTANMDRLVSLCLAHPDVLAARMSGAGLGGMIIVLGKEGFDESLDPVLVREYYDPLGRPLQKIPIVPSQGAGFY